MCSAEPGEKNITFTSRNSKLLEVNYFDYENGLGVTVFSSKQSFHILTTNDKLLFCIEDAIYQDGNDLDQIVVIRGKPFLDHRRHNKASSYFITIAEAEELMEAAELKGNDQSVCKNPSVTKKNVEAAIETVIKPLDPHTPCTSVTADYKASSIDFITPCGCLVQSAEPSFSPMSYDWRQLN